MTISTEAHHWPYSLGTCHSASSPAPCLMSGRQYSVPLRDKPCLLPLSSCSPFFPLSEEAAFYPSVSLFFFLSPSHSLFPPHSLCLSKLHTQGLSVCHICPSPAKVPTCPLIITWTICNKSMETEPLPTQLENISPYSSKS